MNNIFKYIAFIIVMALVLNVSLHSPPPPTLEPMKTIVGADAGIIAGAALEICCPKQPLMTWEGQCKVHVLNELRDYEQCMYLKKVRDIPTYRAVIECKKILDRAMNDFRSCDHKNVELKRKMYHLPDRDTTNRESETPI